MGAVSSSLYNRYPAEIISHCVWLPRSPRRCPRRSTALPPRRAATWPPREPPPTAGTPTQTRRTTRRFSPSKPLVCKQHSPHAGHRHPGPAQPDHAVGAPDRDTAGSPLASGGNTYDYARDRIGFLRDCQRRYGDVFRYGPQLVVVSDPTLALTVLTHTGQEFASRGVILPEPEALPAGDVSPLRYTQAKVHEILPAYPPTWLMICDVVHPTTLGTWRLTPGKHVALSRYLLH
jgi:hypothetical protein